MNYVHGYSGQEADRLTDQANTLARLLHEGTTYPPESRILEAGCGVGSQTVFLAANSPLAKFTSIDMSEQSLAEAKARVTKLGFSNVSFHKADIFNLPFGPESFDHIFLCFVLEHLPDPGRALIMLKKVLKPDGTITVIEGDHGSAYFHPDSAYAKKAIQCLVDIQAALGGNSLIGRALYPLLTSAGFRGVKVVPRMVYVDSGKPELVDGFTKKTFTAMVEAVREKALEQKLISEQDWDKGVSDLYRTAEEDGVFCYTFFKATARK
jgi:ubiquinone/menaquinone biosynthesis C-methylase UbiE